MEKLKEVFSSKGNLHTYKEIGKRIIYLQLNHLHVLGVLQLEYGGGGAGGVTSGLNNFLVYKYA